MVELFSCFDVFSRCVVANGRVGMYEVASVGMLWFQDVFFVAVRVRL